MEALRFWVFDLEFWSLDLGFQALGPREWKAAARWVSHTHGAEVRRMAVAALSGRPDVLKDLATGFAPAVRDEDAVIELERISRLDTPFFRGGQAHGTLKKDAVATALAHFLGKEARTVVEQPSAGATEWDVQPSAGATEPGAAAVTKAKYDETVLGVACAGAEEPGAHAPLTASQRHL